MPESVDAERRTVELVWSTGAAVRRRDPWTGKRYDEVLSLDEAHVDLSRLNGGAPLLNTHGAWDLRDVIGVVERAWIAREGEALVGRATVRFSDRADVEPIWRDVASGIVRNVSVGYAVRSYEITETDGQPPVWRAVDWQPLELSAVPIGADAAAGFRAAGQSAHAAEPVTHPCHLLRRAPAPIPEEPTMTREAETETTPPEAAAAAAPAATRPPSRRRPRRPAPPPRRRRPAPSRRRRSPRRSPRRRAPAPSQAEVQAAAERARAEERHRIATIQDAARKLGVAGSVADDLVARGARRRRRPRRADRRGRGARRPGGDPAARPHRRARRQRDPAGRGRGGAAAPLRPRPLRALRAGARVARPVADRDGARLARGGGRAGPRPQPRRDRHPGAALDLGLPGDPRRRHQQDAPDRLRDRAADLSGDRPAHHRRRLQAGAPAAARRGAAAREGQPVRRVQARHHRRGAGDLPHRDLRQGDRHHPPGADQRRPRRLHPGAGALRHLGGDARERRRLGHLHRQPGDGRRRRRSSTPATRTSPAPARRSTSPGSPRRAPPWRSSAGSTARRC